MLHNPNWYRKTFQNQVPYREMWVLPHGMTFRRFASLRGLGWRVKRAARGASRLCPRCVPVFLVANRRLKSGRAVGFW